MPCQAGCIWSGAEEAWHIARSASSPNVSVCAVCACIVYVCRASRESACTRDANSYAHTIHVSQLYAEHAFGPGQTKPGTQHNPPQRCACLQHCSCVCVCVCVCVHATPHAQVRALAMPSAIRTKPTQAKHSHAFQSRMHMVRGRQSMTHNTARHQSNCVSLRCLCVCMHATPHLRVRALAISSAPRTKWTAANHTHDPDDSLWHSVQSRPISQASEQRALLAHARFVQATYNTPIGLLTPRLVLCSHVPLHISQPLPPPIYARFYLAPLCNCELIVRTLHHQVKLLTPWTPCLCAPAQSHEIILL